MGLTPRALGFLDAVDRGNVGMVEAGEDLRFPREPSEPVRISRKGVGEDLQAISEFPKGRKYLISLSFRGKASVRPAQVGGFDVNIVIHGSTAVRGRGDLVAYRWALWKLTAPWTHRTRPPHLGKRCAFSTSSTGPFPSNHSRKTPKGPKIALGNPDRPDLQRNFAAQLRVGGLPDLSHAAFPEQGGNVVVPEAGAGGQGHDL